MSMQISGFGINVADLDRSADFYTRGLGLQEKGKYDLGHMHEVLVGTDADANKVERVILSPKTPGGVVSSASSEEEVVPVAQMQTPPQRGMVAAPPAPPPAPVVDDDSQPQGDSMPPDTTPQPGDPPTGHWCRSR